MIFIAKLSNLRGRIIELKRARYDNEVFSKTIAVELKKERNRE